MNKLSVTAVNGHPHNTSKPTRSQKILIMEQSFPKCTPAHLLEVVDAFCMEDNRSQGFFVASNKQHFKGIVWMWVVSVVRVLLAVDLGWCPLSQEQARALAWKQ